MKKVLLMMAAALTAWSASAQLYVTGANVKVGTETNSWDAKNALECAVDGEYYTFEANGEFTISTVKADWDAGWKTGTYTLNGNWNTTASSATASLQRVDGNIPTPKAGEYVSYKVKKDFSAIEASFSSQAVETNFRLHGQITSNTGDWETTEMTLNGNCWEYTGALVAGEFGIKECDPTGGQLVWIGGGATVSAADTEYAFTEGGNSSSSLVGTYTISYNPTAKTITFKSEGDTPVPVPATDLVLTGSFNDWATNDATYKMTQNGNTYTFTMATLAAETEFKIKTAEESWATSWGAEGDPEWTEAQPVAVTPNVAMNAWLGSGCNFMVAEALNNVTITFVKSEDASVASTLTITTGDTPVPVPETDLVLTGSFNDWATNDAAYKMTQNGNTYTFTMDTLAAETEFKVKTAEESWATSWGAEGDPEWTEAQPVAVTPNVAMNAWPGSGCNFMVAEALNNVTITFVKSEDASVASTLTVAGTSAIEAIEAAAVEAPAEYYNLQGIRVLAPEAGQLYIVNRAGKVSKEIAR